jgi:uncharacterized membrane protein affecting hemolysin expression
MNIKEKFRSLKIVLSSIVVAIIILLSIILVLISYSAARRSVENTFVNQLTNINKDLDRSLTAFSILKCGMRNFLRPHLQS